jgi:carbon storage regulator
MLILTRKADEHIRIGSDITISVFEIEGNRVKIGVDAPRGVKILRSELEERPDNSTVEDEGLKRAA